MEFRAPSEETLHVCFSLSTEKCELTSTKADVKFPKICPECTYDLVGIDYQTLAKTDKNDDVVGFVFRAHCPNCEEKIEVNPDWFISKTLAPKNSVLKRLQKFLKL